MMQIMRREDVGEVVVAVRGVDEVQGRYNFELLP